MNTKYFVLAIITLTGIISGSLYISNQQKTGDKPDLDSCAIKNPDPDGYLLKICRYLIEHEGNVIPNKNPNDYSIKALEQGRYERTENGQLLATEAIIVRLDCCGTGDLVFVDKQTKEIIGFSPGDK